MSDISFFASGFMPAPVFWIVAFGILGVFVGAFFTIGIVAQRFSREAERFVAATISPGLALIVYGFDGAGGNRVYVAMCVGAALFAALVVFAAKIVLEKCFRFEDVPEPPRSEPESSESDGCDMNEEEQEDACAKNSGRNVSLNFSEKGDSIC